MRVIIQRVGLFLILATLTASCGQEGGEASKKGGSENEQHGDAYCDPAWTGFEHLDAYVAVMNPLADSGVTAQTLNTNGAQGLIHAYAVGESFTQAQGYVVDDDIVAAFDALLLHQELWLVPLAQIASNAVDETDYSQRAFELVQQPGVAAASSAGALASGTLSSYTLQRCGATRRPE